MFYIAFSVVVVTDLYKWIYQEKENYVTWIPFTERFLNSALLLAEVQGRLLYWTVKLGVTVAFVSTVNEFIKAKFPDVRWNSEVPIYKQTKWTVRIKIFSIIVMYRVTFHILSNLITFGMVTYGVSSFVER